MRRKNVIVADSSANLFQADCADFMPVPLKILAGEKEYVDNEALDVVSMAADLKEYKGRPAQPAPAWEIGCRPLEMRRKCMAFPSPAICPAVITPPALPQRNIWQNTQTERYSFWIPCPPDRNWNY